MLERDVIGICPIGRRQADHLCCIPLGPIPVRTHCRFPSAGQFQGEAKQETLFPSLAGGVTGPEVEFNENGTIRVFCSQVAKTSHQVLNDDRQTRRHVLLDDLGQRADMRIDERLVLVKRSVFGHAVSLDDLLGNVERAFQELDGLISVLHRLFTEAFDLFGEGFVDLARAFLHATFDAALDAVHHVFESDFFIAIVDAMLPLKSGTRGACERQLPSCRLFGSSRSQARDRPTESAPVLKPTATLVVGFTGEWSGVEVVEYPCKCPVDDP